ncbi:META domain-containing protein [Vreelandella titanicae]|uniref:META domain-containing protein n=1 Tax=Vreelandella titanicae TaxID=664683 RepID=UPI001F2ACC8E|nr:META domain-containing protein [Halomonas titanicae]MCE7521287.1 META domain-containing protein [Halomonas titanicae]
MKRRLALYGFIGALLITAGCSSAAMDSQETAHHPDETLINTYWKLVSLDGAPVVVNGNFREAHFVLHQDASRLAGATGCNTLMGSYHVESQRITFNQVATTKMACPPSQMKTEQAFLAALEQATAWHVEGAALELLDDNNEPLASFEAVHLY